MRTAAWRNDNDRRGRPEARDIGMSLVTALVTSQDLMSMTGPEVRFVTAALADLEARGFDRAQVLRVLRRLRNRLLDPGDRQGEESESTGPASWETQSAIFFSRALLTYAGMRAIVISLKHVEESLAGNRRDPRPGRGPPRAGPFSFAIGCS
jgi:hypothetical protein